MITSDALIARFVADTASATRAAVLALPAAQPDSYRFGMAGAYPSAGTPAVRRINGTLAFGLSGSATSGVSVSPPQLPSSWTTATLTLFFIANASGFSGDVVFQATPGYFPDTGGGTSGTVTATHTVVTNAAQVAQVALTLSSGVVGWWKSFSPGLCIDRLGADAGDTYSPDVNLLGYRLAKAS
ncbi:hypothetical protein [Nocardioides sp.]|uniref:hypothetical protein n=1 Tax=Nocardioides sp. TaxID=35761 RepID=UPI0035156817